MSSAPSSSAALAADLLSRTADASYVSAHKKELAKEFSSTIKALEADAAADPALLQQCKDKFKEITAPSADKVAKEAAKAKEKEDKKRAEAAKKAEAAAAAGPAAAATPASAAPSTDGAAPASSLRSGDYQVRPRRPIAFAWPVCFPLCAHVASCFSPVAVRTAQGSQGHARLDSRADGHP